MHHYFQIENYRFVESWRCLEHISDFFQIPLFLKLALPDDGQLAHQIFNVSAEMLDGLQTIMEVPANGKNQMVFRIYSHVVGIEKHDEIFSFWFPSLVRWRLEKK